MTARIRGMISDAPHREKIALYKTTITALQGRFSIRGIRPGRYKLLSGKTVALGASLNSVFLSRLESRGQFINVVQQSTNNVELTVIPK